MTPRHTLLLFLALLLVNSSRAVSGNWISTGSPIPEAALVLFEQGSSSGSIKLSIPGFYRNEFTDNQGIYSIPEIAGSFPLIEAGSPELPALSATIQLPAAGRSELTVVSSKYIDFPGFAIPPSPGNLTRGSVTEAGLKGPAYESDAFFPGIYMNGSEPYISRNLRCQTVTLYPFQYNPVTGVLRVYYELEIGVNFLPDKGKNELSGDDLRISNLSGFNSQVLNRHPYAAVKSGGLPAGNGRMLIVCPENFREAIEPFIRWKTTCGIETEVIDPSAYPTSDKLADFIKEYYYATGDLAYLLLVGDAETVPSCMTQAGASDNTYSYIAGEDHYPDILVGRFSAVTVKDLEVQVEKTIRYEQATGTDNSWTGKAIGIASTLGPGDDGEKDFQHVRNLLNDLDNSTYTGKEEYFDGSQGGLDAEGDPVTADLITGINQGAGVILYSGHGSTSSWATGNLNRSALSNLQNAGKYPIIWSVACETGNFVGYTCLAETWMRASDNSGEPLGAVAALMASGTQTTHPPMEGQDEMVSLMVKADQPDAVRSIGGISVAGMNKMNDVYGAFGYITTDTWILFGDPSLQVRTASPAKLKVSHATAFGLGEQDFGLTVENANGTAVLSENDIILGSASLNGGFVTINLKQQPLTDTVRLTVTAFNMIPYQVSLKVIKEPAVVVGCVPQNHSRNQAIASSLKWEKGNGGAPEYYLLYLGTDNPPSNLINGQRINGNSFKPASPFNYHSTYYWRVDAVNKYGTVEGTVHQFETIHGPDEDFEAAAGNDSRWVSAGTSGWTIDESLAFSGNYSCRSGKIGDRQQSSLLYPCEVMACDFVGFWYKVSSESGKDRLQFLLDGNVIGEWSGNKDWTYASFRLDQGSHQLEWRYSKDQQNAEGQDAAWIDDIILPVHPMPALTVTDIAGVCAGTGYIPEATVTDYYTVRWETNGDGNFSDLNLVNPVYTSGVNDIQNGTVRLTLNASGYEGCPVMLADVTLGISPVPGINLPSDIIAGNGESVELDAWSQDAASYLWLPGKETASVIQLQSRSKDPEIQTVTVQVTGTSGCVAEKSVNIHFLSGTGVPDFTVYPNPCTSFFTLATEDAATFTTLKLLNDRGEIVWQQNEALDIVNQKNFILPSLPSSTYLLIAEANDSRKVKQLIIR